MTQDYIRVAANVSDTVYLDEVKAVAFTTVPANYESVRAFVNNPSNSPNVFDMINLDTFQTVTPQQNLYQANVVAFVTKDSSGNLIQSTGPIGYQNAITYYPYIVTKNRGGYQHVQSDALYQILLHVDAQDPNGYVLDSNDDVISVKDLSESVAYPHMSTLVGKQVTTSPFSVTAPMKITNLNGHKAFDGFVRFGRPLSSNPASSEYFDVMKRHMKENYSVFMVFSVTTMPTSCNLFAYIQGQGHVGLTAMNHNADYRISMSICKKFPSDLQIQNVFHFPPTTFNGNYSTLLTNSPMLACFRYKNKSTGLPYDTFELHMEFWELTDNPTLLHKQSTDISGNFDDANLFFNKEGGALYIGGDEQMETVGETYQPQGFKLGEYILYNEFVDGDDKTNLVNYLTSKWKAPRRYPAPTIANGNSYDLISISPLQSEYSSNNKKYATFTINNDGVYTLTSNLATNPDYRYSIINVFQTKDLFGSTNPDATKFFNYSSVNANINTFDVVFELPRPILLKKVEFLSRYATITTVSGSYDFPLSGNIYGIDESGNLTILGTRNWEDENPSQIFDPVNDRYRFFIRMARYNKDVLVILNTEHFNNGDNTRYKKFRIVFNHKHNGLNRRIDGGGVYIFGEEP